MRELRRVWMVVKPIFLACGRALVLLISILAHLIVGMVEGLLLMITLGAFLGGRRR